MTDEERAALLKSSNVFISTPMYGGQCFGSYTTSIVSTCINLLKMRVQFIYQPNGGDSLVTRARAKCVDEFLKTECTHLLFIDADIGWDWKSIPRLIMHDKDIVGGLYPKKRIPNEWPANIVIDKDGIIPTCLETGCIEAHDVPTGFMLIKRGVIEEMIKQMPQLRCRFDSMSPWTYDIFGLEIDDDGILLSEDFAFCRKAQRLGYKTWIDPFIKLSHTGFYCFEDGCIADQLTRAEEQSCIKS